MHSSISLIIYCNCDFHSVKFYVYIIYSVSVGLIGTMFGPSEVSTINSVFSLSSPWFNFPPDGVAWLLIHDIIRIPLKGKSRQSVGCNFFYYKYLYTTNNMVFNESQTIQVPPYHQTQS